jgi:hypothetical protein
MKISMISDAALHTTTYSQKLERSEEEVRLEVLSPTHESTDAAPTQTSPRMMSSFYFKRSE